MANTSTIVLIIFIIIAIIIVGILLYFAFRPISNVCANLVPPSNVTATVGSGNLITVNWSEVSSATGYRIYIGPTPNFDTQFASNSSLLFGSVTGANITSFQGSLLSNGDQYVKVSSFINTSSEQCESSLAPADGVLIVTTNNVCPNGVPTVLGSSIFVSSTIVTSGESAILSWTPITTSQVSFYNIYFGTDPGFIPSSSNFAIGTQNNTTSSVTLPIPSPGTYYYKLVSVLDTNGFFCYSIPSPIPPISVMYR